MSKRNARSWLASTMSNAATVITAAKNNNSSSELRRVGSGGVTATGGWSCVVIRPPGSRCPAEVGVPEVRSPSAKGRWLREVPTRRLRKAQWREGFRYEQWSVWWTLGGWGGSGP